MPKDITITNSELSGSPQPSSTQAEATTPLMNQQNPLIDGTTGSLNSISPSSKTSESTTIKKPNRFKEWISKFKPWWGSRQPWQKILIIGVSAIIFLGGLGASMYLYIFQRTQSPLSIIDLEKTYIERATTSSIKGDFKSVSTILAQPDRPRTEQSPLNGLLFTKAEMDDMKKRRPVAVMTNNHVQARPQSGLSSADIVYEALAESGITRYLAIYWSDGPQKVGPIRSARQYYLEWLSPFDPLFIYDGCALTDNPRTNACGNIYTYALKNIATIGAWRVNDGTRFAPHNEYSSVINTWDYANKQGWGQFPEGTQSLKFKRDAKKEDRGEKTRVKASFRSDLLNGGLYESEWTYDPTSNTYLHRIGGQPDLDLETGKQVNAKTVIVERVVMQSAGDPHGRIIVTTIGEGDAHILQDGKIVKGSWKKTSRTDRTRYYDEQGKEIELNRGRMWIMAVPRDQGKFDILEQ